MDQSQRPRTPPGFFQSILVFTFAIGSIFFSFLSYVVKHNPEHLTAPRQALAYATVIFFFSFVITRAMRRIKLLLIILLLLIALSLGGLALYLQHFSMQLKAPTSEFIIGGLLVFTVSLAGCWLGRFMFQKAGLKSDTSDRQPEATSSGRPGVEWISYDRKQNEVNHGTVDIPAAKRIVDQYISQAKPHYEYGEDAIVETCFNLSQSPETFLYVDIHGPNDISVTLQIERRDVPSLVTFFRGHFYRELRLGSRAELLSLVETFFQITPEDFMTGLSQWSARYSRN